MSGFIKLHRKINRWRWRSNKAVYNVFLYLLTEANYKDEAWEDIIIKRGQLVTGRASLAKSTKYTEDQIRTVLSKLKSTGEITIKTTNRYSLITIVNYDLYQSNHEKDNQQNEALDHQQIPNRSPTDHQQITTIKEYKEIKEYKKKINKKKDSVSNENVSKDFYFSLAPVEVLLSHPFALARNLRHILQEKLRRTFPDSEISRWTKDFEELLEIDLSCRENALQDIQNVFNIIMKHHGERFFYVIESARDLRNKFYKIEAYPKRIEEYSDKNALTQLNLTNLELVSQDGALLSSECFKKNMKYLAANFGYKICSDGDALYMQMLYTALQNQLTDEQMNLSTKGIIASTTIEDWNDTCGFRGKPALADWPKILIPKKTTSQSAQPSVGLIEDYLSESDPFDLLEFKL